MSRKLTEALSDINKTVNDSNEEIDLSEITDVISPELAAISGKLDAAEDRQIAIKSAVDNIDTAVHFENHVEITVDSIALTKNDVILTHNAWPYISGAGNYTVGVGVDNYDKFAVDDTAASVNIESSANDDFVYTSDPFSLGTRESTQEHYKFKPKSTLNVWYTRINAFERYYSYYSSTVKETTVYLDYIDASGVAHSVPLAYWSGQKSRNLGNNSYEYYTYFDIQGTKYYSTTQTSYSANHEVTVYLKITLPAGCVFVGTHQN